MLYDVIHELDNRAFIQALNCFFLSHELHFKACNTT